MNGSRTDSETLVEELAELARTAAVAGGEVAAAWQSEGDLDIREKAGADDLVSQADTDTELTIRRAIERARPQDSVLGEERGLTAGTSPIHWLVDPIDGTTSYLYGREDWAVSVAAVGSGGELLAAAVAEPAVGRLSWAGRGSGTFENGARVVARTAGDLSRALVEVNFGAPSQRPAAGATVSALLPHVRDLRRTGSAAAALAHVAAGRADAYWGPGLRDWDAAAGLLLVLEAGGEMEKLDDAHGHDADGRWNVLAAAPGLLDGLRDLLAPAAG
jgi:myo-inositol-1(or 4)-monophosphatase